jgi:hypothetical protein
MMVNATLCACEHIWGWGWLDEKLVITVVFFGCLLKSWQVQG